TDVCGRGGAGIYCALAGMNGGTPTLGPKTLWSQGIDFGDQQGWKSDASFWSTIRFVDINGDHKADVCGRGTAGIYCGISTGSAFSSLSAPFSTFFSNANSWANVIYYSTIQYADVNGDGYADVCGRASDGVWCGLYRPLFRDFGTA